MSFRLPVSLKQHLQQVQSATGRDQTEQIVDALRLDREIEAALAPHADRLRLWAAQRGLSLETQLPQVVAAAVLEVLGTGGAEPAPKPRKK